MKKILVAMAVLAGIGLLVWQVGAGASFDRLSDADRKILQERFERELWPLLMRGGKDGCVGCHRAGQVTALKFSGAVTKDFPMLIKDGFFIPDDAGNLHSRIIDKDPKRRMPPGKRPGWSDQETAVLQTFILDLDKKQKK